MIRAAVIGGGTAGCMAAAHLSRAFPDFELHHIHDPRIPIIGVGEGTVLTFPDWLDYVMDGLAPEELRARCHMTPKYGILFEGWGRNRPDFFHHFFPVGTAHAYHLSAEYLVDLLGEVIAAEHDPRRVEKLDSDGQRVVLTFDRGADLEVDLCIDARGFPEELDPERHVVFDAIPTNAALLRQTPETRIEVREDTRDGEVSWRSATRTVARPHGWIFVIPLTSRTSYGYVYDASLTSPDEVAGDFDRFFAEEAVAWDGKERRLGFPNFSVREFFDGALMRVGNRASFMEPLEATAIGFIIKQLAVLGHWPLNRWQAAGRRAPVGPRDLDTFNRHLRDYARKLAWFVSWHYAAGSRWDTPFWERAAGRFQTTICDPAWAGCRDAARGYLEVASKLPDPARDRTAFSVACEDHLSPSFGQFCAPSFTQVGLGIGAPLHTGVVGS